MNVSRDIHLNIPSYAVKYKLSLDDLDLALLPMSRLMRYGLGSTKSQPESLKAEVFDGPRERMMVGQQGGDFISEKMEKPDVRQLKCLQERLDCPVVEFVATAERNGHHEPVKPTINQAKDKRLVQFCHICNIAVPKVFVKEHNRSKLHRTLLRLANESVSRLNKHILQQLSENDDTSYCAPCNEEVGSVADHEKDVKHKLLREREELLTTLLYLYTENPETLDEHTENLIKKIESQSKPDNTCANEVKSSSKPTQTDKSQVVAIKNITDAKIMGEDSHKLEKPVTLESNRDIWKNDANSAIMVNDPSQAKLEKQERSVNKPTNEQSGSIVAKSDELLQTSEDTYYFCKICNKNLPNNILDIAYHDRYSSAHIANVEKLQAAEKKSLSKEIDTSDYFCNICAVTFPNKASNIIRHDIGTAHITKLEQLKNVSIAHEPEPRPRVFPQKATHKSVGPKVVPHLSRAAKAAIAAGFYFCNVCAVSVPTNDGNINSHNKGAQHKTKIQELKAVGRSKDKNNTPVMPSVIPAKQTHQSQSTSSTVTPAQASDLNQYYCHVCNVNVPKNIINITEHNNGIAHKAKLDISRKSKDTENVDTKGYAKLSLPSVNDYCTVCDVTTGVGNFEQHLMSKSHVSKVLRGDITDDTVGYNLCKLCDFQMPNCYKLIDEHYSGISHKSNFKKYLAENSIVDLGKKQIRCNVCRTSMHITFVWGHVMNQNHVANLKNMT